MGVGPNFHSPETQEALQQQSDPNAMGATGPEAKPKVEQAQEQAAPAPEKNEAADLTMETPAPAAKDVTTEVPAESKPAQLEPKADSKPVAKVDMNTYIYETLAQGDASKGKENFDLLAKWCSSNMDAGELAAINYMLKSDDKNVVRQGLTMAVGQWRKAQKNPMMTGDPIPTNTPKEQPQFKPLNRDEYIQIMASDKYNSDPQYAQAVDNQRRTTIEKFGRGFVSPEYSAARPPIR